MRFSRFIQFSLLLVLAAVVFTGCSRKTKSTAAASTSPAATGTSPAAAGTSPTVASTPPAKPSGGGGGGVASPGAGGAVMAVRGAVERMRAANELSQLALYYQQYETGNNQPPANLEQLLGLIGNDHPKLVDGLKKGWYVVFWNVRPSNLPAGASNTILAYDEDTPKKGGWVIMADYSKARMMDAQEFAAAPKAGKN